MARLMLVFILLVMLTGVCGASPLQDFSPGRTAVDFNIKFGLDLDGGLPSDNSYELGVTHGLGGKLAMGWRQTRFDADAYHGRARARNDELDLLYKIDDSLQLYAGYNWTDINDKVGVKTLPSKGVAQLGVIGLHRLSDKVTLFANLGGGDNVTNIEVGAAYRLTANLELNGTYRHLSVEKMGSERGKIKMRGFGAGLTYKF